ncbi:MAG: lysophospholipid acyltransferase family protein [Candidatus Brocadiaceae bacterium]
MAKHFLNFPVIYRFVTRWIGRLPTSITYPLSQFLADISYLFYKSAVKNVKQNMRLVFPTLSNRQISKKTKTLFRNYGKYIVDCGRFTSLNRQALIGQIVQYEGVENLNKALQVNKGIILLTAHLGNWELGGMFFGSSGLKINVLTLPDEHPEIDNIRKWHREAYGVKTIIVGGNPFSMVEMTRALNNGEVLAMLVDQYNAKFDHITVDFFHKPTPFPRGPFILSRLTGAPIVIAFVVREKRAYKGIIETPFIVTSHDEEREVLKKVVKIFETYIIKYIDQWYNFKSV